MVAGTFTQNLCYSIQNYAGVYFQDETSKTITCFGLYYFFISKKRGLSADEKKQKILHAMLEGVVCPICSRYVEVCVQHEGNRENCQGSRNL